MELTSVLTYLKKTKSRKIFGKADMAVLKKELLTRWIGFFLAMAMPLPGMAPFGMAYLAQEKKFSLGSVISFLFISLGSLSVCGRLEATKYISAGCIYLGVLFVLEKGVRIKSVTAAIIAGACVFASGMAMLFVQGIALLDVLLLLCEVAALVSGALMMEKSVQVINQRTFSPESLDGDAKLSLAAVIMIAVLSIKEIYIGSDFSVMNVLAAEILLIVAAGSGAGYSAMTGVMLGIVCGIGSDLFMPVLGAFSFCGFLSGLFSKLGKGGTVAGLIIANGIMAIYTNSATEAVLSVYEVLVAVAVFIFIPGSWTEGVGAIICIDDRDRESIAKVKAGIHSRVLSIAKAFEKMSKTIDGLSEVREDIENEDIATMFDVTADKVCAKCRKSTVCWGRDFNSTYNDMFGLWNVLKETGAVKPEDVKEHFAKRCLSLNRLLDELNHQFDIYRVRQLWRSKVSESRKIVGKQLGGMSAVLEGLTAEIDAESGKSALSVWEIRSRLEMNGIKVRNINVFQNKYGRNRIELVVKEGVYSGKQRRVIEKTMRAYLGNSIKCSIEPKYEKKLERIVFSEAERFTVETSQATMAASEKSGDNFRMINLKGGKFVIAISDGMGTGSRASRESEAMLELLDSFLQAGFDSRTAVRLINSIMIMKSEKEEFVTLDLCIIDLFSGETSFIKTGAEPSFILNSSGNVKTVAASALPVGILADAEAETEKTRVHDGDSIVMITDGVESRESGSLWVSEFIKERSKQKCDKSLADEILNRAVAENNGTATDDMTVLSVKLKAVG